MFKNNDNEIVLPPSSLGYASNNVYAGFPPRMSDGRALIASYQPEAVTNNQLLVQTGIHTNWQYRKYLTDNALDIIEYNRVESFNDVGYVARYQKSEIKDPPYRYKNYLDKTNRLANPSNLKDIYLTREELNAQRMTPRFVVEDKTKQ